MDYPAPWSRYLIVVSTIASAVLVGAGLLVWRSVRDPRGIEVVLAPIALVTLAGCLLFVIRGYRVDGAQLYIRRLLWETAVDLRDLQSIGFDPSSLKGSIKLFGNGGLFSISGVFWNRNLGRYRAFVTDHSRAVVLGIGRRTIVISPGDPEGFVREVVENHPRIRTSTENAEETTR